MDHKKIVEKIVSTRADPPRKRQMQQYYDKNKRDILEKQKEFREKNPVERRERPGGVSGQRRRSYGDWNAAKGEEVALKFLKRYARVFGLDRIYSPAPSGDFAAHFDLGGGGFTMWFEDEEDNEVFCEMQISGEAHGKVDDLFYKHLDEFVFDSERDFLKHLDKAFDELIELRIELEEER